MSDTSDTSDSVDSDSYDSYEEEEEKYVDVPFKDQRWKRSIHKGHLHKYTVILGKKTWKNRFFILTEEGELWHFKNIKKKKPVKENPFIVKGCDFGRSIARRHCIELHRKEKPFILYGESYDEISSWIFFFEESGGIFNRERVVTEPYPQFLSTQVSKWKNSDVLDWLSILPTDQTNTFGVYEENFKAEDVNGRDLLSFKSEDLKRKKLGISNFFHQKLLFQFITSLRKTLNFDLSLCIVLRKLMFMSGQEFLEEMNLAQLFTIARNLSDPRHMVRSYLTLDSLKELIEERKSFYGPEIGDEDDEEDYGTEIDFSIKFKYNFHNTDKVRKYKNRIPIQIVIIDSPPPNQGCLSSSEFREYVHPIVTGTRKYENEFIFSSAVKVGPFFFEWAKSSLIIPRRLSSKSMIIATNVYEGPSLRGYSNLEEVVDTLARVFTHWNTRNYFCLRGGGRGGKKDHLGNCQDFVEDVRTSLGIVVKKSNSWEDLSAFRRYLKLLQSEGEGKMRFVPSQEFCEKFSKKKMNRVKGGKKKKKKTCSAVTSSSTIKTTRRKKKKKKRDVEITVDLSVIPDEVFFCNILVFLDTETLFESIPRVCKSWKRVLENPSSSELKFNCSKVSERYKTCYGRFFKTHVELDEYVIKLRNIDMELILNFPSEMRLLKSFDRAFWMRHLGDKSVKKYQPLESEEEREWKNRRKRYDQTNMNNNRRRRRRRRSRYLTGCPFHDPRETHGYVV